MTYCYTHKTEYLLTFIREASYHRRWQLTEGTQLINDQGIKDG